jgi:hypothetical protein
MKISTNIEKLKIELDKGECIYLHEMVAELISEHIESVLSDNLIIEGDKVDRSFTSPKDEKCAKVIIEDIFQNLDIKFKCVEEW